MIRTVCQERQQETIRIYINGFWFEYWFKINIRSIDDQWNIIVNILLCQNTSLQCSACDFIYNNNLNVFPKLLLQDLINTKVIDVIQSYNEDKIALTSIYRINRPINNVLILRKDKWFGHHKPSVKKPLCPSSDRKKKIIFFHLELLRISVVVKCEYSIQSRISPYPSSNL